MSPQQAQQHSEIVLFYKYFIGLSLTQEDALALQKHQQDLCEKLQLKGRVLISTEGINGTVSAMDSPTLEAYIQSMQDYEHTPTSVRNDEEKKITLYENIDWKRSTSTTEPFPDLKISLVQEIVSTGGTVAVDDLPHYTGTHLSPQQFHDALQEADVVIDVRNTFEYDIGHFMGAVNPEMTTFSSFVQFCTRHADEWRDKNVLMYCTGGIRCEKASAMLKQRGVQNVSQLQGGIHRYLEEFGSQGKFLGKNFVFDQRVAMAPSQISKAGQVEEIQPPTIVGQCLECQEPYDELCGSRTCTVCRDLVLVCPSCRAGGTSDSNNHKKPPLREYHCKKHQAWKDCYFYFLESFTLEELQDQKINLEEHRNALLVATQQQTKRKRIQQKEQRQRRHQQQQIDSDHQQTAANGDDPAVQTTVSIGEEQPPPPQQQQATNPKNIRRTLLRQIEKIEDRIQQLQSGQAVVESNAPRRCRTCQEPLTICDGRCWGFWKTCGGANRAMDTSTADTTTSSNSSSGSSNGPRSIEIGDHVEPGPHWKEARLGTKYTNHNGVGNILRRGTVVQVKTWAGQEPNDCVAVVWEDGQSRARNQSKTSTGGDDNGKEVVALQPQIYRWGLLAVDGTTRLYDVQKVQ